MDFLDNGCVAGGASNGVYDWSWLLVTLLINFMSYLEIRKFKKY